MIVLFTANLNGGIIQFTLQLLSELTAMGEKVKCFLPENSEYVVDEQLATKIVKYKSIKKNYELIGSEIKQTIKCIELINPSFVWFTDQLPESLIICKKICHKIKTLITVHDVTFHPTNEMNFKARMYRCFLKYLQETVDEQVGHRIFLSKESYKKYISTHNNCKNNSLILPLGAHIPNIVPKRPTELDTANLKNYILFIGRIDRYKGISTLTNLYTRYSNITLQLVVAGSGELDVCDRTYFEKEDRIVLINRYIKDEEFIYLVKNSSAVILPYIEASQSGVIPIAYKFGIPVIVSDVEGLCQFVDDGATGYICKDLEGYKNAIENLQNENKNVIANNCKVYYDTYLNWKNNLSRIMKEIV